MEKSLQEQFIESRGCPVKLGKLLVMQADKIPVHRGLVRVSFLSPADPDQGVCLKARKGWIELSDGSKTERLHIWNESGLRKVVELRVDCPTGELLVWNIYRVHHPNGETTEDNWTGDSGMILVAESPGKRRYACNDWSSPFEPSAIEFEIEWEEVGKKEG